jgi:hypothetical protein
MTDPKVIINTKWEDGASTVTLALRAYTMIEWLNLPDRKKEMVPTLELSPTEAREFARELIHYANVADSGFHVVKKGDS